MVGPLAGMMRQLSFALASQFTIQSSTSLGKQFRHVLSHAQLRRTGKSVMLPTHGIHYSMDLTATSHIFNLPVHAD